MASGEVPGPVTRGARGPVIREVRGPVAVVLPTAGALSPLRPLDGARVDVTGGFWGTRLELNRERSIPHGFAELERVGNFANLRLAAGAMGDYQALGAPMGLVFPFLDSDVYKWLEAAGWELGRKPDQGLTASADEAIALVAAAQRPDGYINSFVQVVARGQEYRDLQWGHEMYCVGHLLQAGIAWHRALGDDRLLEVGIKAADSLDREFGPSGREGIDGHPEIEMALVELFRVTAERRYLELAARMIELRGHGRLGPGPTRLRLLAGPPSGAGIDIGGRSRGSTALPGLRRSRRCRRARRRRPRHGRARTMARHDGLPRLPDRGPGQPSQGRGLR